MIMHLMVVAMRTPTAQVAWFAAREHSHWAPRITPIAPLALSGGVSVTEKKDPRCLTAMKGMRIAYPMKGMLKKGLLIKTKRTCSRNCEG